MIRTLSLIALLGLSYSASAAEPKVLFDGKTTTGWMNAAGEAPNKGWLVEDGALVRKDKAAAGDIWTKERFGDFILEVEFKTAGNSGVFFRTDNPKDNVQTGIEIQVDNPSDKLDRHSVGAIYDLVAPTKSVAKKGEWNTMKITALDSMLSVEVNGTKVSEMDLNLWKDAGKNPDGTANKYKKALKDWKREGHIGLQDHGAGVAYRNIKITPIEKK